MTGTQQALNFSVPPEAQERLNRQCTLILECLRKGPATNIELVHIAQRFGARLHDLKRAGYEWEKRCISAEDGVYEYRLKDGKPW
jgi:hypothetical protein